MQAFLSAMVGEMTLLGMALVLPIDWWTHGWSK